MEGQINWWDVSEKFDEMKPLKSTEMIKRVVNRLIEEGVFNYENNT